MANIAVNSIKMLPIYLDYNATTPIAPEVADAMRPFLDRYFGNPSSMHEFGAITKKAVEHAREQVAACIGCYPDEIVFTSGGSESNNMAIKGVAEAYRYKGRHIITSVIEHPAVMEVCRYLENNGFSVTRVPVDEYGVVNPDDVRKALRQDTMLITIMHANNETGSIQPIEEIAKIAKSAGILFHSDCAQSLGKITVNIRELGIDLMSIAGHKIYAPKGIGALYIRRGVKIEKLIHGANHEMNMRAGTENVLEIVGLGKACELISTQFDSIQSHLKNTRDLLEKKLFDEIKEVKLNGHPQRRLPNTLNISFYNIDASLLLSSLNGIAASAGAACHAGDIKASAVIEAMHVAPEYAMGTVRFSTGRFNTMHEMEDASEAIISTVKLLRTSNVEKSEVASKVKLTHFTHGLGCACKLRPQDLEKILQSIPLPTDKNILVSASTSDDAAVYQLTENTAVVHTLDFFTPIVDDPYLFGAISAANSLSDIYAMGAKPLFALSILAFPARRLSLDVAEKIIKGASEKAAEAGISIIGGHSIEDNEPKFGLSVCGLVHPEKIIRNSGAKPGDSLILTKAIGTGVISTAIKRKLISEEDSQEAIVSMLQLNNAVAKVMLEMPPHACTDITGFGLIGHLREMITGSNVNAEIYPSKIQFIHKALELATEGVIPGGTLHNIEFTQPYVSYAESISLPLKYLLNDPQTSGGLLMALPAEKEAEILSGLHNSGVLCSVIGVITDSGNGHINVC